MDGVATDKEAWENNPSTQQLMDNFSERMENSSGELDAESLLKEELKILQEEEDYTDSFIIKYKDY